MADELSPQPGSPTVAADSSEDSPLKKIVLSRWWGAVFLWIIMANTFSMALYRPAEGADSPYNKRLELIELIFLFVFTFELICKLIGLGGEFFKDGWNKLDFVIVITGYMVFLPGDLINTSVFRTVRVLRPLRSIGMMPGVRILIDALIMSLPGLSTLLVLVAFVYAIFGVMGVQMFKDSFLNHCVPPMHCVPDVNATDAAWPYLSGGMCTADGTSCTQVDSQGLTPMPMPAGSSCLNATLPALVATTTVYGGQFSFCIPDSFGVHARPCAGDAAGMVCVRAAEELHHDASSFRNFGQACVVLFQIMTTEGWTTIFSPLLAVAPNDFVVYGYFISLIFVTSFFMVNFVMAQMVVAFSRACEAQNHLRPPDLSSAELIWRSVRKLCDDGDSDKTTDVWAMRAEFNDVDLDESGELDEEEIAELAKRLGMSLSLVEMDANGDGSIGYPEFEGWWRMRGLFDKYDADGSGALDLEEARNLAEKLGTDCSIEEMDQDEDGGISYDEFAAWWNMRHKFNEFDINGDQSLTPDEIVLVAEALNMKLDISDLDEDGDGEITYQEFETWFQMRRAFTKLDQDGSGSLDLEELMQLSALLKCDLDIKALDDDNSGTVDAKEFETWWASVGKFKKAELRKLAMAAEFEYADPGLGGFVTNKYFSYTVLTVVMLNFIVLAMDHHLIDNDWLLVIDYANLTFTVFFLLELILKIIGLGPVGYFSDRFNNLDFFVVGLSLVEMAMGSDGAFSALRTLRLLRTFKVFAASASLRKLLQVTMKGGAAILNFGVLLFFFLVIYALVGMHFFGMSFKSDVYHAPGRFDSFYWAFLTVFQVLTRENWHELLYVGFGSPAGWTTFVYFGSLIVITNYIILSLFLGNMLHNLEQVRKSRCSACRCSCPVFAAAPTRRRECRSAEVFHAHFPAGLLEGSEENAIESGGLRRHGEVCQRRNQVKARDVRADRGLSVYGRPLDKA